MQHVGDDSRAGVRDRRESVPRHLRLIEPVGRELTNSLELFGRHWRFDIAAVRPLDTHQIAIYGGDTEGADKQRTIALQSVAAAIRPQKRRPSGSFQRRMTPSQFGPSVLPPTP